MKIHLATRLTVPENEGPIIVNCKKELIYRGQIPADWTKTKSCEECVQDHEALRYPPQSYPITIAVVEFETEEEAQNYYRRTGSSPKLTREDSKRPAAVTVSPPSRIEQPAVGPEPYN